MFADNGVVEDQSYHITLRVMQSSLYVIVFQLKTTITTNLPKVSKYVSSRKSKVENVMDSASEIRYTILTLS